MSLSLPGPSQRFTSRPVWASLHFTASSRKKPVEAEQDTGAPRPQLARSKKTVRVQKLQESTFADCTCTVSLPRPSTGILVCELSRY